MERIAADQLRIASTNVALPRTIRELLCRAAYTIEEMDKDIAVMETMTDLEILENRQ